MVEPSQSLLDTQHAHSHLPRSIPVTPASNYVTLIIESLGFNTFQTNLLTIPAYVLFVIQLIFWTRISEWINNRFIIVLYCQIWILPLLISLEILPGGQATAWARYVLNIMLIGYPYIHAILGELRFHPTATLVEKVVFGKECELMLGFSKWHSSAATPAPSAHAPSEQHCTICVCRLRTSSLQM